jgi:Fuc2NAc and GlcNAc transferase
MTTAAILMVAAAFVVSVLITGLTRKMALSRGVLDLPNERSSHTEPTPRGGGASIVLTTSAALIVLAALGALQFDVLMALGGGGLAVAAVGFFDDRHTISAKVRIAVHFASAGWALAWLGGVPPLQVGHHAVDLGWLGYVLGTLGITWTLNLFNFMDGIDGIAATEAVFICSAAALLMPVADTASVVPVAALTFAAACCGFLVWNWPPARIFMGDIGSGYVGFVIAVLALVAARENPAAVWIWLILGGVFFVDATVTLLQRLARREAVYEAHRSHAYQWLARRWGSHLRVTLAVLAVNLVWLLPGAVLATAYPQYAAYVLLGNLLPLVFIALLAGAGCRERTPPQR